MESGCSMNKHLSVFISELPELLIQAGILPMTVLMYDIHKIHS